jgi:hypothetical protein
MNTTRNMHSGAAKARHLRLPDRDASWEAKPRHDIIDLSAAAEIT